MLAIAVGTVADVQRELQDEPNLDLQDYHCRTAWLLACAVGDVTKAKLLREKGVELDVGSLEWAVRGDCVNMVRWLLWLGANPELAGRNSANALIVASESGAVACVDLLLKSGMNPNIRGNFGEQPINLAANSQVVQLFVNAGANIDFVDGTGYSILLSAIEVGDTAFVRDLLSIGANPNHASIDRTPLWYAVQSNQYEIAKILLEAGADPNQKTEVDGWFALEDAQSLQMVELLLEHGANPLMQNWLRKRVSETHTDPKIIHLLKQAEHKATKKT